MKYDEEFLEKTLSARGVDIEKVNLEHVRMISSNLERTEESLKEFEDLSSQIPMTIVDKEELSE